MTNIGNKEMETLKHQQRLIKSLHRPECYGHPVERIELIETHISWVLLTGRYAYKIKKGVDFGFLDYSTLERRRQQCEEELRLNRRTAPQLYLEVVPIGGSPNHPIMNTEPAIDYAVKMVQFPQQSLLSQIAARGEVGKAEIVVLADSIADFHARIEVAAANSPYGDPERVYHPVKENFEQIREHIQAPSLRSRLDVLERHSSEQFARLHDRLSQRKRDGFIRDCHGDLHLNNIVLLEDKPLLFDCIEFNSNLRIIDVISELAFLVMDLEEHGMGGLANLLLNRYLERSGDYGGLRLMPFYLGYRAMVRAKVATLRLDQPKLNAAERDASLAQFTAYLQLAETYARPRHPRLVITHGLSGSGKTSLTQRLLTLPGVVRVRSDVERKRLFGLDPGDTSRSAVGENIYTAEASQRTYHHLLTIARAALEGGYSVIVDAAFLHRTQREPFRALAHEYSLPFTILHFEAAIDTLIQRVTQRRQVGVDASEADAAVLQHQLSHYQELDGAEQESILTIDSEHGNGTKEITRLLRQA